MNLRRVWMMLALMLAMVAGLLAFVDTTPTQANPYEVICDNLDPSCFSALRNEEMWADSRPGTTGLWAGHAWWTYNNSVGDWGQWTPNLAQDGLYEVYIRYPNFAGSNPATSDAHYYVRSADGETRHIINQTVNHGDWIRLATVPCPAGTTCNVRVTDQSSDPDITKRVWIDAARFVRVGPFNPPVIQSIFTNRAVANAGEVPVIITGNNFEAPISARIGSVDLRNVTVESLTKIHAVVPVSSLAMGGHDLTVTVSGRAATLPNAFTVRAPLPPTQVRAMFVLAGDNDLEGDMRELFNQFELALVRNPDLRIAVLWDGDGDGDSAYYLVQPDDRLSVWASYTDGINRFPLGEVNTGDPNTLIDFASWAQAEFPANVKMLSLVGHGGGWAPDLHPGQPKGRRAQEPIGGMLWDDHPGSTLATRPMAEALKWINLAYTFDVIYLDGCLMGTIEVASEIAPYTQYLVAHENYTWAFLPYLGYLSNITSATTPESLARQIAQDTVDAASKEPRHPNQIAVITTSQMPTVTTRWNTLAETLRAALPTSRAAIAAVVAQTAHVDEDTDYEINDEDSSIDAYDFAARLIEHPDIPAPVKVAAQAFQQAMQSAILVNYTHSGTPWEGAQHWDLDNLHGLSVYFPVIDEWKRDFYNSNGLPEFARQSPHWIEFIDAWHGNANPPPPPITPCVQCPAPPLGLVLSMDTPPTIPVGQRIWIPIYINNVSPYSDLRGLQFGVVVSNPTVLEPARNAQPRESDFVPDDSRLRSVLTDNGWKIFLTTPPSPTDAVTGTGVIVYFPFYARQPGEVTLSFEEHRLANSRSQPIAHQAIATTLRVVRPAATVQGQVFLQGRPNPAGVLVSADCEDQDEVYTTTTTITGTYTLTDLPPEECTLEFSQQLFVTAEREVELTHGQVVNLDVGLWAGDLNGDDKVTSRDWRIVAAASIPVSNPRFDINGDGTTDILDGVLVENNISRSPKTMRTTNPPAPFGEIAATPEPMQQAADAHLANVPHLHLVDTPDGGITLRSEPRADTIYAVGVRLKLPAGATVVTATLPVSLTDAFLDWHQVDDRLYIVLEAGDGGLAATAALDLVYMATQPEVAASAIEVEAVNAITAPGPDATTTLFLPHVQR